MFLNYVRKCIADSCLEVYLQETQFLGRTVSFNSVIVIIDPDLVGSCRTTKCGTKIAFCVNTPCGVVGLSDIFAVELRACRVFEQMLNAPFFFFFPATGDAEEGMGNSHGPPGHHATHDNASTHVPGVTSTDEKPGSPLPEEDMPAAAASGDKSVLQAKLTNLAIQIGYGGKQSFVLFSGANPMTFEFTTTAPAL
jgi:hypothetical protein